MSNQKLLTFGLLGAILAQEHSHKTEGNIFEPISSPFDRMVINVPPKERPDSRRKYIINGVEILALTKFEAIKKYKKGLRR